LKAELQKHVVASSGYLELGMLDAAAQVLGENVRLRARTATGSAQSSAG
jgi:hypothetical protein